MWLWHENLRKLHDDRTICLNCKTTRGHQCKTINTDSIINLKYYFTITVIPIYLFIYLFICLLFRATPTAYGGSQVRGLIRVAAAAYTIAISITRSELRLRPTPQLMAVLVLNPLSKARDRTWNLLVPGWIHFRCTMTGIPFYTTKLQSWKKQCGSCTKTEI